MSRLLQIRPSQNGRNEIGSKETTVRSFDTISGIIRTNSNYNIIFLRK